MKRFDSTANFVVVMLYIAGRLYTVTPDFVDNDDDDGSIEMRDDNV